MKRFGNILFVAEGTPSDDTGFCRALALAESNQAALTVIGVVDPVPEWAEAVGGWTPQALLAALMEEKCQSLERMVAATAGRKTVRVEVRNGRLFLEVIREVLRAGHDLVIKTSRVEGGLKARLFGGSDMHLLRKCPCPVWLLKPGQTTKFRRILAAVDMGAPGMDKAHGDALSRQILEIAASLAAAEFAELHCVHVWDAPGERILRTGPANLPPAQADAYVEALRQRHLHWFEELMAGLSGHIGTDAVEYLKPRVHFIRGIAQQIIPALASERAIDLIVMGTLARSGIPGLTIGNTAETILGRVECSVLALKPEGFVSPVTLE